jgi:peptide/nickel transport system substrate-binding protein
MNALTRVLLVAVMVLSAQLAGGATLAQKYGGILRVYHRDNPAHMSIHEEGTISVLMPMMAVFNNLVVFNQHEKLNRLDNIVPDLAESWAVSEDGRELTFKLRQGVKWHDGKPFTAADVKCTWDLLQGKAAEKLRLSAREAWWANLDTVSIDNDYQATFHLKRPQPSFLAFLAAGFTPVYPCHVSPAQMRQHPIGTGPFKFVEFKPNQSIKLVKNPDYWKQGRPYLDGIDYTIIPNRSTQLLAFVAGNFDMTFPYELTVPMLKDVQSQMPTAVCEITPTNFAPNLLMTERPPFDNRALRKAIALTLDRQAFIDILGEGKGDVGTAMLPGPEGQWAMPREMRDELPGYGANVVASREEARGIMQSLGYGPNNRLAIKITTRNIPDYRDAATILSDQLKQIYIDADLELVETANWLPKLVRGDFVLAQGILGSALDDPDQTFYENYNCTSNRNFTKYCDRELETLLERQSAETDLESRRRLVWEMDRRLQRAVMRPILFYMRKATCMRPEVKGVTVMANSSYNGWRMEDVWLDK